MGRAVKDTRVRIGGISLLTALVLATNDTYQQPIRGLILAKLLVGLTDIIMAWHLNRYGILHFWITLPLRSHQTQPAYSGSPAGHPLYPGTAMFRSWCRA